MLEMQVGMQFSISKPDVASCSRKDIVGSILVKELIMIDKAASTRVSSMKMRSLPFLRADTKLYDMLHLFQTGRSAGSVQQCNAEPQTVHLLTHLTALQVLGTVWQHRPLTECQCLSSTGSWHVQCGSDAHGCRNFCMACACVVEKLALQVSHGFARGARPVHTDPIPLIHTSACRPDR